MMSILIKNQTETIYQMNFISIIFFLNRINHAAWMVPCQKRHNTLSNLSGRSFSSITVN
ncbi:hypothetical protein [Chryseobacterium jejuense]|uniref:hypothetical protein n=1 Tax=Chryseobacterium jejuense TaxID=445960 RepID=UPI001428CA9F|nr:hypothetical protein [Chryseobacterium jejuense]